MQPGEGALDNLARAVLDGDAVDWVAAESHAVGDAQPLVRHLRLVASIAELLRDASSTDLRSRTCAEKAQTPAPVSWNHLRILERIGHGAFGEVFRAWDTRLDREVALKLLPAGVSSEEQQRSSIIREGKLLARVRHPNVVTIYGAEQVGDRIGLWMEFVRGQTLERCGSNKPPFPVADVIAIGIELARAVAAVHGAGVLHRDIKAHNVTRADDGRIVLMDFGTGRELDERSSSDLAGTPLYLAPEVLAGGPATVQSDLYSLGVLLYHLVTGSYPIRARTIRDVRRAHQENERVGLRTERPEVPRALARVIERAIDTNPARRYPNADALARDLTQLQRRPRLVRFGYGAAAVLALVLVAFLASEVRARMTASHRSLSSRLVAVLTGTPTVAAVPVIVVVPFRNLSADPDSSRLVDSLTAGLIQQLGVIEGLKVTHQQSSFMIRDKPRDLASFNKQLGANLAVRGAVERSADRLVIEAALVPIAGGPPLWSDTLTREVRSAGDLTDVLTEIARTIVNKLRLRLERTQRRYTTDIATYETYLRARALRDRRFGRVDDSIPLFEEVIRRDPSFAPAYAALAAAYGAGTLLWPNAGGMGFSPGEAVERMAPLTDKALEIDPMLAEAHASQASMHALSLRWVDAEASYRRAIELDPTITSVYGDFVLSTLQPWGRLHESRRTLEGALAADPLSLDLRNTLAIIHLNLGQPEEALVLCHSVIAEDPDFPLAEELCARALAVRGRTGEALDLFNKRPELNEGWIGYVYSLMGRRAEAETIAARNAHLPHRQALIYAGLGDMDRAFTALEQVASVNVRRAASYLSYFELRSLQGDPRAAALREKMRFPRR